jgi:sugar transferase (PEP-CTERM/EpsH1 system associated)
VTQLRILFIAPRIPYPPLDRENCRPYHAIRFLSLRHDVDLVTFGGGGSEWEARRHLRRFCPRVQILPLGGKSVIPASTRHIFSTQPLAVQRYGSRDLMERLAAVNETQRYDLVYVYSAAMAPYGRAFPLTPKILDLVEVTSLRWIEYAARRTFPASTMFKREGNRLMHLERSAVDDFQRVLLASETEAEVLRGFVPAARRVTSLKTAAPPHAPLIRRPSGVPTILIAGHLDHHPNRDAALHFMKRVFPRIRDHYPDAVLRIAGRNPPDEVRQAALEPGVFLDDRPTDLRASYGTAWVSVVPHRVSRGVRNEILESLTFGVPTVVSRQAFVGVDALAGTDLMVADDDEEMARMIEDLFSDPQARERLGFRARRAMLNNYSHWSIALRLEEIVEAAVRENLMPTA